MVCCPSMSDLESSTFLPFTQHAKHLSPLWLQDICPCSSFCLEHSFSKFTQGSFYTSLYKESPSQRSFPRLPYIKNQQPIPWSRFIYFDVFFYSTYPHLIYYMYVYLSIFPPNYSLTAKCFSVLFTLTDLAPGHLPVM